MTRMIQLVLETKEDFNLAKFLNKMDSEFLSKEGFTITSAGVFERKGKKMMNEGDE